MFLAEADDIKQLDKLASQKYGIPVSSLMENAGMAIYQEIKNDFQNDKFAVFCGKGNNGGDGFVVGRLLALSGCKVTVYLACKETEISDIAKIAFKKLTATDVKVTDITDDVHKDAVIIDALLGVSISGAPRGKIKDAIDKIVCTNNIIVSIDVPSGVNANNGEAAGSVVKADYTYTLALDKVGLNLFPGKVLCGKKKVLDIGIPIEAVSEVKLMKERK